MEKRAAEEAAGEVAPALKKPRSSQNLAHRGSS
jgi:hypothetical protein